jgi:sigma-B regulation protein RsbU (phosphoserine phosphatase)
MFLQGRLIGFINAGPKLSGKVYSQEDIDLLSTVGGQAAIAIENARLHQSEIEIQRFEKELALARDIQQSLLPKANPVINGLDISGISIPASTVGGDYYDYIELGDGKLLVVVGDVSGKGVSAALYMSKIQGMIQVIAPMHEHPRDMLVQVNRRIYESMERKSFITMILALFDLRRKEVLICRAGHSKALIGVNGSLEYLRGGGIGLGLERGPVFEQELEEIRRPLHSNSLFVFYSDGLTEAMNEREVPFGEETVFDLVRSRRSMTAQQLQDTILTSVEEYRGTAEQNDDLTVVVVKSRVPEG